MSAFNGTWKLIYADNVGEYCDAIGTKSEFKEKALQRLTPSNDITQEINCKDSSVSIVTKMPGALVEVEGTYGKPLKHNYLDDRLITTIFSLEGDVLKEEHSGSFTSTNVRYVENGQLIYKMTAGGVTTTRKYQKM